jgi:hypothetical protein
MLSRFVVMSRCQWTHDDMIQDKIQAAYNRPLMADSGSTWLQVATWLQAEVALSGLYFACS